MSMNIRCKPLDEREELVVRLHRDEKLSHPEIARRLGVSEYRVREIHAFAKTKLDDFERNKEESLYLLPSRAQHVVICLELGKRAQVKAAIETGGLWWDERRRSVCWEHRQLRSAGWQTWVVLHEWAGLPKPGPKKTVKCPHCGKSFEP